MIYRGKSWGDSAVRKTAEAEEMAVVLIVIEVSEAGRRASPREEEDLSVVSTAYFWALISPLVFRFPLVSIVILPSRMSRP